MPGKTWIFWRGPWWAAYECCFGIPLPGTTLGRNIRTVRYWYLYATGPYIYVQWYQVPLWCVVKIKSEPSFLFLKLKTSICCIYSQVPRRFFNKFCVDRALKSRPENVKTGVVYTEVSVKRHPFVNTTASSSKSSPDRLLLFLKYCKSYAVLCQSRRFSRLASATSSRFTPEITIGLSWESFSFSTEEPGNSRSVCVLCFVF